MVVSGSAVARNSADVRADVADLPEDGVHATLETRPGVRSPAAISVGSNPTLQEGQRTLETQLLDWSGDIYGRRIRVTALHRLRT